MTDMKPTLADRMDWDPDTLIFRDKNGKRIYPAIDPETQETPHRPLTHEERAFLSHYSPGPALTAVALENPDAVANALEEHQYEDWYVALLSAAVGETGDVYRAIEVANAAYEEWSADSENLPDPSDVWEALGTNKVDALRNLGIPAIVENLELEKD